MSDSVFWTEESQVWIRMCSTCRLTTWPSDSDTWYDNGPLTEDTTAETQTFPLRNSLTSTASPMWNSQSLDRPSWLIFCTSCFCRTFIERLGFSRSSREQGTLPSNHSEGGAPMVEWEVSRYQNKKLESLNWMTATSSRPPWTRVTLARPTRYWQGGMAMFRHVGLCCWWGATRKPNS